MSISELDTLSHMTSPSLELAQLIGQNVRRIRGNKTMEDVAKIGRRLGFKWSSGSVAAIEKGEARVTLETLAGLCIALAREGEVTLPLSELIPRGADVTFLPPVATKGHNILAWLQGDTAALQGIASMSLTIGEHARKAGKLGALDKLLNSELPSPAEIRLAKRLDEKPEDVQYMAQKLWNKSFEMRRDELAGVGASPQRKGQIARRLQNELKAAFHGDD